MSRILLADDSPHAQRMGERILREEGYEVVTVTDGETALIRMSDVDPDVVLADVLLPRRSGYEICDFLKKSPKYRHARVILLAGLLEPVDQDEAQRVKADGVLKKPLEASAVIAAVKPLAEAAKADRAANAAKLAATGPAAPPPAAPTRVTGSILGLSAPPVAARPVAAPPAPAPRIAAPPTAAAAPPAAAPLVTAPSAPRPAIQLPPKTAPVAEPRLEPRPAPVAQKPAPEPRVALRAPGPNDIDPELVRAAVTVALDRAMPSLIDEITDRVLESLRH